MFFKTLRPNLKHFYLIAFTGLYQFISAQNTISYDSTYLNNLGQLGKAKFEYQSKGSEKIKTGDFSFTYLEQDSSCSSNLYSENWKGFYENNAKAKSWEYDAQDFSIIVKSVNEESVDYDLYEIRKIFKLNYKEGYPDGKVVYSSEKFINQKKTANLEELKAQISDAYLDGDLFYSDDLITVKGTIKDGLLEGEWTFQTENEKEIRQYKRGILTNIVRFKDKDTTLSLQYPLSNGIKEKLEESDENNSDFQLADAPTSLTFSDGYPRTSKWVRVQEKYNDPLRRIIEIIFQYDPKKVNEKGLIFGTNRGIYPLSNLEEELVKQWQEVEFEYRKELNELTDSLIAHVSFKEDSVYRMARMWLKVQEELQEQISPWKTIIEKNQLQFYNRNGLLVEYGKSLLSVDSVEFKDTVKIFNYICEDTTFLGNFVQNLKDRKQIADSLNEELNRRVKQLNLSAEIESVSAELSQQLDDLTELYNDYPEDYFNGNNIKGIQRLHIEDKLPAEYRKLINHNNLSKQKQLAGELSGKLTLANAIVEKSYFLQKHSKMLDSLFTETTFDPFTYEKVPTRAKKRLYNIVMKEMIPALLDDIKAQSDQLADVHQLLVLIEKTQHQLKSYRDLDTRKLERSLRRNKSLDDRLEIMRVR